MPRLRLLAFQRSPRDGWGQGAEFGFGKTRLPLQIMLDAPAALAAEARGEEKFRDLRRTVLAIPESLGEHGDFQTARNALRSRGEQLQALEREQQEVESELQTLYRQGGNGKDGDKKERGLQDRKESLGRRIADYRERFPVFGAEIAGLFWRLFDAWLACATAVWQAAKAEGEALALVPDVGTDGNLMLPLAEAVEAAAFVDPLQRQDWPRNEVEAAARVVWGDSRLPDRPVAQVPVEAPAVHQVGVVGAGSQSAVLGAWPAPPVKKEAPKTPVGVGSFGYTGHPQTGGA
jgi:hypothetical protein